MSDKPLTPKQLRQVQRGRWSTSTARAVLAAQQASGETLNGFARHHGLHPQRLFWWRKRLEEWSSEGSEAALLVPVVARALPATAAGAPARTAPGGDAAQVTLRLGQVLIEVADASAVQPGWLAALVLELRR